MLSKTSLATSRKTGKSAGERCGNALPKILFAVVFLVLLYITVLPLSLLFYSSFIAEPGRLPFEGAALSFSNYVEVLSDRTTYLLLWHTAVFTIGSTVLGLGLAIGFAWLIERTDVCGRNVLFVIIIIPMAIPNMIYAAAWVQLLNPQNGLINTLLTNAGLGWMTFNIYSLTGMILVQGLSVASHAFLLVAAPFKMLDPTWEEQSAICGKGVLATLGRVTLPALKPAMLAAIIFFTIVNMETFEVPGTLGLPSQIHVFSTRIYWATRPESGGLPDYGLASTLSVLLLVAAFLLILLYQRQTQNAKQFVTITGKGYRAKRIALRGYRPAVTVIAFMLLFVVVALPLSMLIWRSFTPFYIAPSISALGLLSLKAYRDLFDSYGLGGVLYNTTLMALTAAIVTTFLASLIAWMVLRAPVSPGMRSMLNRLAFLPMAIPSIVIGLSLIFVYLTLPIPIYGTIWIIALAMITKYIAFSSGTMMAAQMQISKELEEASQIAGAGWGKTYRRVIIPLLGAASFNCFLWVVIHVVRELAVAVMLYGPRSEVLSTKVWSLWEGGWVAQASALGVLIILVLVLLLALPAMLRLCGVGIRRFREPRVSGPTVAGAFN